MSSRLSGAAAPIQWILFTLIMTALPLLGIIAAGRDPLVYLEFPPLTQYVQHAGFSWGWFYFFAIVDLLSIGGLVWAIRCGHQRTPEPIGIPVDRFEFPWWGFAGMIMCLIFWILAWMRLPWFIRFQPHTFQPIWLGFILTVNALSVKRSGTCLMLRRPLLFFLLFPSSAGFWWIFEYFNRFVQNWYYTGVEGMGAGQYIFFATLAFATVLPAVISMIELLLTVPALGRGLARCRPIQLPSASWIPWSFLAAAAVGLALIGIFPDQLFALLWVSPLIVILSVQRLAGRPTLLHPLTRGDFRPLVVPALAALICGFFWEMWNFFSLARWTYTIPFVQRFHIFEMPILGYGGYLPFGLECLVAGRLVIGDSWTIIRNT